MRKFCATMKVNYLLNILGHNYISLGRYKMFNSKTTL